MSRDMIALMLNDIDLESASPVAFEKHFCDHDGPRLTGTISDYHRALDNVNFQEAAGAHILPWVGPRKAILNQSDGPPK